MHYLIKKTKNPIVIIAKAYYVVIKKIKSVYLRKRCNKQLEKSFHDITSYAIQFNPITLISQLIVDSLFIPTDRLNKQKDALDNSLVWLEFLIGYLLTVPLKQEYDLSLTKLHLEKNKILLKKYFENTIKKITNDKLSLHKKTSDILFNMKAWSLCVRGDTYSHKSFELAKSMYQIHNKWFVKHLGFTISDCIDIFQILAKNINEKLNASLHQCLQEVIKNTNNGSKQIPSKRQYPPIKTDLFYKKAASCLSFQLDDLIKITKKPKPICKNFLTRMSQEFGYKNEKFPNTFTNAAKAPWDYNALREKPIIKYGKFYLIPLLAMLPETIFNTFNYDLLSDKEYRDTYSQLKGEWLEKRTATALRKFFTGTELILNPTYKNGDEFCDILILKDRKIFIVECKSKQLTHESKVGNDLQSLKNDIKYSLLSSFKQAKKSKTYLKKNRKPTLYFQDKKTITIEMTQATDIFLVSVTSNYYQHLFTKLTDLRSSLDLIKDKEYFWSLSIADLETIVDFLEWPSQFIHYTKKRLMLEDTKFTIEADEMDILNLYFSTNLSFNNPKFQEFVFLELLGASNDIDDYMINKHQLYIQTEKPRSKISNEFRKYIDCIEGLNTPYRTDCLIRLLDLDHNMKNQFVEYAKRMRTATISDNKNHCFSFKQKNYNYGVSFISMNANKNKNKLFSTMAAYCLANKYMQKAKEWIGISCDKSSNKIVDNIFFTSHPWTNNPEINKLAKSLIKKRRTINIKGRN